MRRHLKYLLEELIALSLFDKDVARSIREEIAERIRRSNDQEQKAPYKKATTALKSLNTISQSSFASGNTELFFKKLSLPDFFHHLPEPEWETNSDYKAARQVCKTLAVTNDHAERAIAFIHNYSRPPTKNKQQLSHYLLQAVAQHQNIISEPVKKSL